MDIIGVIYSGVPNLQAMDWYQSGPVRNQATQHEVSLNAMCLNPPKSFLPLPPQSLEKLSFMKLVPDAKKVEDHWLNQG